MDKENARLLIIDDDYDVLKSAHVLLKRFYTDVHIEQVPENIYDRVRKGNYDVILLDMNYRKGRRDGDEGFFWLERIRKLDPDAVVVMITAYGDMELAIKTIKAGATDFIMKPWNNQKLMASIHSALQLRNSRKEADHLRLSYRKLTEDIHLQAGDLVRGSEAMNHCMSVADRVSATDADVLILGENGTGKELISRSIHLKSDRSARSFVHVDLGAISESLFESELFGHVKGAFTDAKKDKPGRIELAHRGTLFLDEIGNLSPSMQMKLLSVLEKRATTRIGSVQEIPVDFRLISATNSPLHRLAGSGTFREDLLYRINTVEIHVPPLRERREDIPLLIDHFLKIFKKKYHKQEVEIAWKITKKLSDLEWPGNVRELRHTIERAVILCEKKSISLSDLIPGAGIHTDTGSNGITKLEDMERQHILKIIERNRGNITRAAVDLGISRTSLHRRLRKYGI
jgi:DNA-binding NtrC family response regulator